MREWIDLLNYEKEQLGMVKDELLRELYNDSVLLLENIVEAKKYSCDNYEYQLREFMQLVRTRGGCIMVGDPSEWDVIEEELSDETKYTDILWIGEIGVCFFVIDKEDTKLVDTVKRWIRDFKDKKCWQVTRNYLKVVTVEVVEDR